MSTMLTTEQQRGARRGRELSLLVQGLIATTLIVVQLILLIITANARLTSPATNFSLGILPLLAVHTSNA